MNQVADNKETEHNCGSIDYEDNVGALPPLKVLAEDEGDNINAACRATAKEGQRTSRTNAKTTEERRNNQGNISVSRALDIENSAQHVRRDKMQEY